jgi:hypothetical protein
MQYSCSDGIFNIQLFQKLLWVAHIFLLCWEKRGM